MLISFLNNHPNIHVKGEIFNKLDGKNYKDILAKVFAKQPYNIKAKGFKIFYYHPNDDQFSGIWDDLVSMENLMVIHLKRRNIFRTLISRKIAEFQDVWAVTSSNNNEIGGKKAVTFTVEELQNGFKQTRAWEKGGDEMFKKHALVSVYYEDLVSDPDGALSQITDFLDVQYMRPITDLKKQNPERLRDLVINYDELKAAFSGSEWQPFFED
jgi:hypothetical protein